jgi:hypothetical protein
MKQKNLDRVINALSAPFGTNTETVEVVFQKAVSVHGLSAALQTVMEATRTALIGLVREEFQK